MTYTFKLARKLAVSRPFAMLPALIVIAACSGGDATAPDGEPASDTQWRPRELPVSVTVNPSSVTLETNQLIQFRAHGNTSAGDTVDAAVSWSTSGGTILPDGRFSAAAIGTYTVIGVNRVRGEAQVDTSFVTVVRRQTRLARIEVTPTSISLAPGVSRTFTALGRLPDGTAVPIGVNWAAGGGSIDAGGTYVAGDTAGNYRVTATNTAGTLADTVSVTITAPPTPPPPSNTATKVILMPWSVTLAPNATAQFATFGRTAAGDSVGVSVTFSATGGKVTPTGLFTAGATPGTYRIIATTGSLADTSSIKISSPLGSGTPVGIPFGPVSAWDGTSLKPAMDMFSFSFGTEQPTSIINRLSTARSRRLRMVVNFTGGAHSQYLTDGVFDRAKWTAKLNTFNTPEIREAVAAAVADGTLLGASVLDEPNHYGLGDPTNSWGPKGTFTKVRVDSLCADVKQMFPTIPVGVSHGHNDFEPANSYRVCEFIIDQYAFRKGEVTQYRDEALAMGRRDGMAILFGMNLLDGGEMLGPECPQPQTGGPGTLPRGCRMTSDQVREWGKLLGSSGCAMSMWRYDDVFMADPNNVLAFKDVAAYLATLPAKSCRRTSTS